MRSDGLSVTEKVEKSMVEECFFFLMRRQPPRSTQSRSSAASDVYKRQSLESVKMS